MASSQQQIRCLGADAKARKARKRGKVKTSPNSKFANVEAIYRTQVETGETENSLHKPSESNLPKKSGSHTTAGPTVRIEQVEQSGLSRGTEFQSDQKVCSPT